VGRQRAHRLSDIGDAIQEMREGGKVRRKGWNGKGMYLFLVGGSTFVVAADKPLGAASPNLVGKEVKYHPHVDMMTAQGYVVPWLCSQADLLADDWEAVD
jgi:Protein of unknown function (DUF2829)